MKGVRFLATLPMTSFHNPLIYNDLPYNESALKARYNSAHGNAMGRECTRHICALKGQHIVENKYIALSGRRFIFGHLFNPWRCHGLKYLWLSAIILRASSFCLLFEYFNGGLGMTGLRFVRDSSLRSE